MLIVVVTVVYTVLLLSAAHDVAWMASLCGLVPVLVGYLLFACFRETLDGFRRLFGRF